MQSDARLNSNFNTTHSKSFFQIKFRASRSLSTAFACLQRNLYGCEYKGVGDTSYKNPDAKETKVFESRKYSP